MGVKMAIREELKRIDSHRLAEAFLSSFDKLTTEDESIGNETDRVLRQEYTPLSNLMNTLKGKLDELHLPENETSGMIRGMYLGVVALTQYAEADFIHAMVHGELQDEPVVPKDT